MKIFAALSKTMQYRGFLIAGLLCWVCCGVFAQNNPYQIDDRIYPVLQRALNKKNSPNALKLSDSIILLAKRYKNKKAEVLAYTIPVDYYARMLDEDNTSLSAYRLRKIAKQNNHMQYYYYAYSVEGRMLLNDGQYAEAINLLGKMRTEATAEHNAYGLFTSYIGLGHVYHTVYNYMEAERLYVMAAELAEKEMPEQTASSAWLNAATVALKNEDFKQARRYLDKAKSENPPQNLLPSIIAYMSFCHYMLGQNEDARNDCKQFTKIKENGNQGGDYRSYLVDYTNAMLAGNYEDALEIAESIDDFSERLLLSIECHNRMGDYEQALKKEQEKRNNIQKRLSEYMETNVALMGSLLQLQNDSLKVSNLQLELAQQNLALENKGLELQRAQKDLELNKSRQENTELELQRAKAKEEVLMAEQEKNEAQYKQYQLTRRNREMALMLVLILLVATVAYMVLRVRSANALRDTNKKLTIANEKAEENLQAAQKNLKIAEENKKRAEHSEQMKTMFIQNMSHEIRTPLNAIVGFSQLLTDPEVYENLSQDDRKNFMDLITNNSNLLTKLVNDILNLSDLQSGKYKIARSTVMVNEICKICLMNVDLRVPQGVKLYFTSDLPDEYTLFTDQQRVQQVLYNLLTNACKYTEEGEIHLHASLQENPGYVTFSVTDTGKGIPADKAESIFDRFEKLDEFIQGTGLGLPICRMIATILKGEVRLDTGYTNGARFIFQHPIDA